MESIEKLRNSSHLDDNKWTLSTGEVFNFFGSEPIDHDAINWGEQWRKIADEIEAEIAEKYMELPVDADGVPIRVGDMLNWEYESEKYTVCAVAPGRVHHWIQQDGKRSTIDYPPNQVTHYKQRTLEDVLEDYVVEYQTRAARSNFGSEHFDHVDVHEMVKRCADEIRDLMGGTE